MLLPFWLMLVTLSLWQDGSKLCYDQHVLRSITDGDYKPQPESIHIHSFLSQQLPAGHLLCRYM